jgi:uncharacterized membrane protein YqaE (UPF0057 family)
MHTTLVNVIKMAKSLGKGVKPIKMWKNFKRCKIRKTKKKTKNHKNENESVKKSNFAYHLISFQPIAVLIKRGCTIDLCINIVLTILGLLPVCSLFCVAWFQFSLSLFFRGSFTLSSKCPLLWFISLFCLKNAL